jgi:CRP/FNR family transcriptional regulator
MTNTNQTDPSCNHCSFALFCSSSEKDADPAKKKDHAIRRDRHLKKNEVLCLPNHKFQNLYAIKSGALKAYQIDADGKELINDFYFAGEIFGFEAIHSGHYPASAVALSNLTICEISYERFLGQLQGKPALQEWILYLISKQLNLGHYLNTSNIEQRLAAFLIDLSVRLHSTKTHTEFVLPITRQDIGNYLRLSAETISRIFSKFRKNKLITLNQRKIRFLQPEKLKEMAG